MTRRRADDAIRSTMTRLITLGAVLVVAAGCSRDDDVRVRVSRVKGPRPARIENVTLFVGANKSSWPELAPGEVVSVVLNPDGEPPQLTLTFTLDTEKRSWLGPPLAQGAGYVSDIVIDDEGSVTEQHCRTPCALP